MSRTIIGVMGGTSADETTTKNATELGRAIADDVRFVGAETDDADVAAKRYQGKPEFRSAPVLAQQRRSESDGERSNRHAEGTCREQVADLVKEDQHIRHQYHQQCREQLAFAS